MAAATPAIVRQLRRVLDEASIPDVVAGPYLADETEARGLVGSADAVAMPASAEDARAVVAWCYAHDVAVIPRGGGTGFAGGCVPLDGGVVLSLERVLSLRSFDPLLWRMEFAGRRFCCLGSHFESEPLSGDGVRADVAEGSSERRANPEEPLPGTVDRAR